ncbi:MAG: RICIN domain-containing protein, partial [Candidatus Aminicenantes bacterium]
TLYVLETSNELYAVTAPTHFPSMSVDDSKTSKPPIVSEPPIKQAGGYIKAIPLPSGPPPKLNPSEYYKIISKANGNCVFVGGGEEDGDSVWDHESHAGDGQRWKFIPIGEDYFRIRAKKGGRSLTVHDVSDELGIRIVVSGWNNSDNQIWKLAPIGDGYYAIISKLDDTCLDVESKTGPCFKPSNWLNKDSQRWKFKIPIGEVCEEVSVLIESIYIAKADDFGTFGEAGEHAEWKLTISINGFGQVWRDEYVKDGMTVDLDWNWVVFELTEASSIQITADGIETDSIGDDQLPAAVITHNSSDNWGIGPTRQLVGKNKDFHYVVNYSIRCTK